MRTEYEHGRWNVICDRCGFKYKSRQVRREWTGLMVCSGAGTSNCWEERHPQEKLRARADKQSPPWTRPEAPDVDVSPGSGNEITVNDL